ncbi:Sodium:solute symporter family protein [Cardinium endosymbiont of Sogatella furcifera]|uniref:sodium:solute symporter family protein n=1 Tax=Cardinium endosymbiont of Sogatella furcifera TaxID=650378 RepID=UPI000E109627|nr:sodium:solute symporter family protein [Cardinium endosymbiont of Sogatella furcifera]AXI24075.1 Sodium:solute symporter family protein [Cardinium endosymbiont of Sogatella furcifera]
MASFLDIPLFMVVSFLLLTLVVGIYFSRKITSLQQYAVGNRQFATATLVATVLATAYGEGGLMRNVQQVHQLGLYWIILDLLAGFDLYIISKLALYMGRFMGHLSMPETMGSVYGKYARIITALSGICDAIATIAMQISAMSLAISLCLDSVHPKAITVVVTVILIGYSSFGGIRAVAFTDVLQFITFAIIIPILAWFMLKSTGKSVTEIIPFLQSQEKFQLRTVLHFDMNLVAMCLLLLSFLMGYIEPPTLQRVYMSSSTMQAGKVFLYATIFSFVITLLIMLIGLFVFVAAPDLPVTAIWGYIMAHVPPVFKGMVCISLLAMAMSTADSKLNACAVMISHDMLQSIRGPEKAPYAHQLRLAMWTSIGIGVLAMVLTFYCNDLLNLLKLSLDFSLPIATAPFILAVLGFRGTARTALIGMGTGIVSILAWNQWIEPKTAINGSFICMVANGLAMMVAHYLFKQPENTGWIGPDRTCIQMKQVHVRKQRAQKEAIKNGLIDIKATLAKLQPSHVALTYTGIYIVLTNLLVYCIASIMDHGGWLMAQLLVGACFLGYKTFLPAIPKSMPGWLLGLIWVIGLSFCLPINAIWHWWQGTPLLLNVGLSLAHLAVTLLVFPLYLGVSFVMVTLCMTIYCSAIYCTKPFLLMLSPLGVALLLLLCLGFGLLILGIFIYLKGKINACFDQVGYLKDSAQMRASQKHKEALYDAAMASPIGLGLSRRYGSILGKAVHKMEEAISFLDSNMPLCKQDFQSIINKLYDWVAYFSKKEQAKAHALLQPDKISLDQLINKLESTLSQEVADPPRLLVEQTVDPSGVLASHMVCDVHQVVYSLVQAVLRVSGRLDGSISPIVSIQLHATALQFKRADAIDSSVPDWMLFQAIGWVVRNVSISSEALPKVKPLYSDQVGTMGSEGKQAVRPSIDLQQETIASIVYAHYGYVEYPADGKPCTMLLVLPIDVTEIRDKMMARLPIDCLTSAAPVTPKEQADAMMALMQFHDYVCRSSCKVDPIDVGMISNLLLLLRQHFGLKRHASGQLFYIRVIGIAELVIEWAFHSPKVIYAALLYELVRHTCLPLSYVKEHYNLGVYACVLNVVGVDKRQSLDHPSLLYVQNRLKEAIKEDHVQLSVLFIKLAERLYDLRHAFGYTLLEEVKYMAYETLIVDVVLAKQYLGSEIAEALSQAAKQALEIYHQKAAV